MSNTVTKISYINELTYRCNTINKGFIYLLKCDKDPLEEYEMYCSKSIILNDIEKFSFKELSDDKAQYFFKHVNLYFDHFLNEKKIIFSTHDKYASILSSITAFVDNPLNYIFNVLANNNNDKDIVYSLKTQMFKSLLYYQLENNNNKKYIIYNPDEHIHSENINKDFSTVFQKIKDRFKVLKKSSLIELIYIMCDEFKRYNTEKNNNISLQGNNNLTTENIIETKPENKDESLSEIKKDEKNESIDKDVHKSFKDNLLNNFFNPMHAFVEESYDKYKALREVMTYDSYSCRAIKTVLYIATYLLKDKENKDFKAAQYMNNLVNADIGWAVGDENNKNPSFYGDNELAKVIYGYYSYMNAKENPYTDIIGNKIIKDMDYNAMLIHKYFKEHGTMNMGLDNDQLKEVYNVLVNFKEIVKIIDSPISLSGTYDNFISGIISSILNSVALSLDFAISELVKSLFYAECVTINNKMYSISQVYNYLNFIKLVLENAGEYEQINHIDKQEFIDEAYSILGIDQSSIKKTGYLAYSKDVNHIASLNLYDGRLYKNSDEIQFTARVDLKLFYSLIQFGIQKKTVLTGDVNYENKFSYGDEFAINDILNYLTETEIYYIFTLYNINLLRFNDNFKRYDEEEIDEFNKTLLFIDVQFNHHSTDFYNLYLLKNPSILNKDLNEYGFSKLNYNILINSMKQYYFRVLKYNKKQMDSIVFEANDISDVDDFLVRFIPSITELLRLLGQDSKSIKAIANLIDAFLLFISEVLFRNLFVNVKGEIHRLLKKITDTAMEKLNKFLKKSKDEESEQKQEVQYELVLDPDFGSSRIMQAVDLIIKAIENGKFNLLSVESCFKHVSAKDSIYDPMEFDDLIYNYGHDIIIRNDFADNTIGSLDKSYIGAIQTDKKEENKNIFENMKDTTVDIIKNTYNKIFYENGEIKLEKKDGSTVTVVNKNDMSNNYVTNSKDVVISEKKLSQDEVKQLIEIRDYIQNVSSQELLELNKQKAIEEEKLKQEMQKPIPNFSFIKNIKKKIDKLTSQINDVKTKNRIKTNDDTLNVTIQNFDNNFNSTLNSNPEKDRQMTLYEFFKNKKEVLKEINKVAINNEVILTNYQITELLK